MGSDLLAFCIDRLRGRRSLVDEIVDVSATLVKDSDVPGNLEICRWSDVPGPPRILVRSTLNDFDRVFAHPAGAIVMANLDKVFASDQLRGDTLSICGGERLMVPYGTSKPHGRESLHAQKIATLPAELTALRRIRKSWVGDHVFALGRADGQSYRNRKTSDKGKINSPNAAQRPRRGKTRGWIPLCLARGKFSYRLGAVGGSIVMGLEPFRTISEIHTLPSMCGSGIG
jgi:hypothetical protein